MARKFRTMNGGSKYRKWKDWEVGDFVVGKFVDTRTDNYGKPNWILEVEEFEFDDEDMELEVGDRLGLNSCGSLDAVMEDKVDEGMVIRVEYAGKSTLPDNHKFAGKEVHSVIVQVAEDEDSVDGGGSNSLSDDDDI